MTACTTWRFCLLCRQSVRQEVKLIVLASSRHQPSLTMPILRRLSSGSDKSLQPSTNPRRSGGLTEPLEQAESNYSLADSKYRRSADPNNELREYIEYSKINSWHAAVGRRKLGKQRWKYERLVIGACAIVTLLYIYIRPENSVDEQFTMNEFGKGLFRPHPAMEHHIAATIQTVEARGGDATLYRNQLKILLKEKELQLEEQRKQGGKADVKYDPKVHDVKY